MSYQDHLHSASDLVTPYREIRAGFIQQALEKNNQATPYVAKARALKLISSRLAHPRELLDLPEIRPSLLTAAGVSAKAASYLNEDDQTTAILGLIENFLEPAGTDFVEELVFRYLLTCGDAIGGIMRNIGGVLAARKLSRTLIATLDVQSKPFTWLDATTASWLLGDPIRPNLELSLRGLHWHTGGQPRTLLYNINAPIIRKNVDLCLFAALPGDFALRNRGPSAHRDPAAYVALGELKGGIDPAGADEHWKTANSALERIRTGFASEGHAPHTFFIAAAIARAMADEIYAQLELGRLSNAANLTNDIQLFSLCRWLVGL